MLHIASASTGIEMGDSDAFYHNNEVDPELIRMLGEFHYWRKKDSNKANKARRKIELHPEGAKWGTYSWAVPHELLQSKSLPVKQT